MSALKRPCCRWRALGNSHGELRLDNRRERTKTPEPSSNRMQMDSTWGDTERCGDGQPRVERQRWRDSVVVPRTPSNPRRWVTPRPDFPAQSRQDDSGESVSGGRGAVQIDTGDTRGRRLRTNPSPTFYGSGDSVSWMPICSRRTTSGRSAYARCPRGRLWRPASPRSLCARAPGPSGLPLDGRRGMPTEGRDSCSFGSSRPCTLTP